MTDTECECMCVALDADGRGSAELIGGSFAFTLRIPIEIVDTPADRRERRRRQPAVRMSRFSRWKPTGYDHFIAGRYGGFARPESVRAMHRDYRGKRR